MKYGCIKSKLTGNENVYEAFSKVPNEFIYNPGKILDQGDKPICTSCSVHTFLNWEYKKDFDLNTIFKNSNPTKEGASLKDTLKYLQSQKLIDNYALVKSPLHLKIAILLNGPCVGALPVYNESSEFWIGNDFQGGHAISIIGWKGDEFIIKNSWGSNWGNKGLTTISDISKFYELWTLIK